MLVVDGKKSGMLNIVKYITKSVYYFITICIS